MKLIGARLLVQTVQGLEKGILKEKAQDELISETAIRHAPKIFTDTCKINWNDSAEHIHNLIRGLSPYPGALTILDEKVLKIFSSRKETGITSNTPGTMQTDGKTYLRFTCTDGYIYVLQMQLEGKKKMSVEDFLRGYRPLQ